MSYTVLARKYRPQSFDELVGQGHVARTIANAIAQGRVAHAFLFTGVRGVGKTTTARLLAKSLNCEQGPTATPCNVCGPCVDITAGRDVDVQEIDGASNNSVDDVRRLQESLPFRPSRDRFKIVIVDEVHMLSTGAFNAFLKTLEEPPPHVKFIFATTEIHKVPITIRSRCQRYDFRLIAQVEVAARVREILGREGITADDATVAIVSREAAGSMRDALTLLDQVVAYGGTNLVSTDVARVLGIAALDQVRSLATALCAGDPKTALATIREAEQNGADALHFGKQMLETLRDLVVLRVTGDTSELVHWVDEERTWAVELTRGIEPAELSRLFAMTMKVVDEVARSATPIMALEMGCLRVATRPRLGSIDELVAKLEALEARMARGGSAGPGGPGGQGGPGGPGGQGGAQGRGGGPSGPYGGASGGGSRLRATATGITGGGAAGATDATSSVNEQPNAAAAHGPAPTGADFRAPRESEGEASYAGGAAHAASIMESLAPRRAVRDDRPSSAGFVPAAIAPAPAAASEPPAPSVVEFTPGPVRTNTPSPATPATATATASTTAPAETGGLAEPDSEPAVDSETRPSSPPSGGAPALRRAAILDWEPVVRRLRETQPSLAAIVEQGEARLVSAEKIVLVFQEGSFFGRQASQPQSVDAIASAAELVLGGRPVVEVRLDASAAAPGSKPRTLADVEKQRRAADNESRKREALGHPAVLDALDVFPDGRGKIDVRFDGEP